MIEFLVLGSILGIGLLLLKTGQNKPSIFIKRNGRDAYAPMVRDLIIRNLLAKEFVEIPDTTAAVTLIQSDHVVPEGVNAWYGLQGMHSLGRDIWISPNIHLPSEVGQEFMAWIAENPPAKEMAFVLLIKASDPWPPLPTDIPPIPSSVPPIPTS